MPPTCCGPVSTGPLPTIWRAPSTTRATPCGTTGPIPTCRHRPMTSAFEDTEGRARKDLYRAYDRLGWLGTWQGAPGSEFYVKAARDLYSAARRDLEAGRDERAGELARAAEAMTHVPEHLDQIGGGPGREVGRSAPAPPAGGPVPKTKGFDPPPARGGLLPPELPPGRVSPRCRGGRPHPGAAQFPSSGPS